MFSVILNNMSKAKGALGEASAIMKADSRRMQDISADAGGNYALEKCRRSLEALSDKLGEYYRESRELSECLQDILDCYRDTEDTILEMGYRNGNSAGKVEFGIHDYQTISDIMESMDIKFVTI